MNFLNTKISNTLTLSILSALLCGVIFLIGTQVVLAGGGGGGGGSKYQKLTEDFINRGIVYGIYSAADVAASKLVFEQYFINTNLHDLNF